jgi:hypothetical protein
MCVRALTCVYEHSHVCTSTHMCVRALTCVYEHSHVCTSTHMCVNIYICIQMYINTFLQGSSLQVSGHKCVYHIYKSTYSRDHISMHVGVDTQTKHTYITTHRHFSSQRIQDCGTVRWSAALCNHRRARPAHTCNKKTLWRRHYIGVYDTCMYACMCLCICVCVRIYICMHVHACYWYVI